MWHSKKKITNWRILFSIKFRTKKQWNKLKNGSVDEKIKFYRSFFLIESPNYSDRWLRIFVFLAVTSPYTAVYDEIRHHIQHRICANILIRFDDTLWNINSDSLLGRAYHFLKKKFISTMFPTNCVISCRSVILLLNCDLSKERRNCQQYGMTSMHPMRDSTMNSLYSPMLIFVLFLISYWGNLQHFLMLKDHLVVN